MLLVFMLQAYSKLILGIFSIATGYVGINSFKHFVKYDSPKQKLSFYGQLSHYFKEIRCVPPLIWQIWNICATQKMFVFFSSTTLVSMFRLFQVFHLLVPIQLAPCWYLLWFQRYDRSKFWPPGDNIVPKCHFVPSFFPPYFQLDSHVRTLHGGKITEFKFLQLRTIEYRIW